MKKQMDLQLIAILGGGLLFNFLFWHENLALNLLLYTFFIFIVLFANKKYRANKKAILTAAPHLLAAVLVVYNQSDLTIITYYISLVIFIGFTHAGLIKSVGTAFLSGFLQLLSAPVNLIKKLITIKIGHYSIKPILKPIKYIVIPAIVLFFFTIIYSIANPIFEQYLTNFSNMIGHFTSEVFIFFFGDLNVNRIVHCIFGILLTAGILLGFKENRLEKAEINSAENLTRKRRNSLKPGFWHELKEVFMVSNHNKKMALKTKNLIGIISFAALNLLLLFLNCIDISTLWLGNFKDLSGKNYSTELHEGTNALIFSIVMAMIVILYFFNGNLNFFSKNKHIKRLAFLWIAQNAFLACSVLLRDYNYIALYGLTYKRIGIFAFLLLCAIGLFTVYIKVVKQKTFFYLYKTNVLIWYILLICFGFVNWDVFVVNYNISHRKSIALDPDHLLDLSDKTLPLLDQHRELLITHLPTPKNYENPPNIVEADSTVMPLDSKKIAIERKRYQIETFNTNLSDRIEVFNKKWDNSSWLSWNYRDWQTHQYFRSKGRK